MCVGDWRIGRFLRSVSTVLTHGQVSIAIPQNRQRVGLFIWPGASADVLFVLTQLGGNTVSFASVNINAPLALTLKEHGHLVTKAYTVSTLTASTDTVWTEVIATEEILALGEQHFNTEYGKWQSQGFPVSGLQP